MKKLKKTIAVLLSVVMLLTLAPLGSFATETEPCNHLFKDNAYYNLTQKNCVNCGEPLPLPPAAQIEHIMIINYIPQETTHVIFGNYADYEAIVSGEGLGLSLDNTSVRGFAVDTTYYVLNMNPNEPMMTINSLAHIFSGHTNLKSVDFGNLLDISYVYDACNAFIGCTNLEEIRGTSNWNSDRLIDVSIMFADCVSLKSVDLSSLKMINVTNMYNVFRSCKSLTSITLCPDMDTSKVTTMDGLFENCNSIEEIDVSMLDTQNVTNMSRMFFYCKSLKSLDLSGFDTSNVTTMRQMFNYCDSIEVLDLSNFDTSNVTTMEFMFAECTELKVLDISSFDCSNVTNFSFMLFHLYKLKFLNATNIYNANAAVGQIFNNCFDVPIIINSALDKSGYMNANNLYHISDFLSKDIEQSTSTNLVMKFNIIISGAPYTVSYGSEQKTGERFLPLAIDASMLGETITYDITISFTYNEQPYTFSVGKYDYTIGDCDLGNHSVAENWAVITDSTCVATGRESLLCTACGVAVESRDIPLISHSFDENGICAGCGLTKIKVGEAKTATITEIDGKAWFIFTPEVTGVYLFESTLEGGDTYGAIYNADKTTQIAYNDDIDGSNSNFNFGVEHQLFAGNVYLLSANFLSNETGDFPVLLTLDHKYIDANGDGACDNCGNTNPHDCIDDDVDYHCDICSAVIPHNCVSTDADGICDLCSNVISHNCVDADENGICDICSKLFWTLITVDDFANPTVAVIENGGDAAWFKFVPEKTGAYVFESNLEGGDTYGCLYGADRTSLLHENDDRDEDDNFRITRRLEAGKVYFWKVAFVDLNKTGEIPLSLTMEHQCLDEDENYRCDQCSLPVNHNCIDDNDDGICDFCAKVFWSLITLDAPGVEPTVGVIEQGGDIAWFKFIPEKTDVYIFESTLEHGDTFGALFNADRTTMITSNDDIDTNNANCRITYELEAGEVYFWAVRFYSAGEIGDIPVSLTAIHDCVDTNNDYYCDICGNIVPHDCFDDNDDDACDVCGADVFWTVLTLDGNECSSVAVIENGGDKVYFRFVPKVTSLYSFESNLEGGDTYCYLYNADGSIQITNNDDREEDFNFRITYQLEADTAYFFVVKFLNSTETGEIPVLLSIAHNCIDENYDYMCDICEKEIRGILYLNIPKTVTITSNGNPFAVNRFYPSVSGTYIFEGTSSSNCTIAAIYDSNDSVLDSSSGGGDFRIEIELEAGKLYAFMSSLESYLNGDKTDTIYTVRLSCAHSNKTSVEALSATCYTAGHTAYELCNVCGEKIGYEETAIVDHSFTTYTSNNNATCSQNSTETAYCDNGCGTANTRDIPNSTVDHSFTNYTPNNNATCTQNGTETAYCDFGCGEAHERDIPDTKLPHSFVDGVCTECEAEEPTVPEEPDNGNRHPLQWLIDFIKLIIELIQIIYGSPFMNS